ncbi:Phosphoglycerate mutase [Phaffia rhodozyma]|uniref:Phosphoglycerate mutase n=1 Tax=Phaffia rhodozyma TaxID=264483 RepID=A0A0F7SPK2_PHARH|nr:Phosphoglycerate mutase [Phaffia rhodozyma]
MQLDDSRHKPSPQFENRDYVSDHRPAWRIYREFDSPASMSTTMGLFRDIWAGSRDTPLSNHGMNQAKALGGSFKGVRITQIYASPLLRAKWTAEQIFEQNEASENLPPIVFSPLMQEQNFGQAEGKSWNNMSGNYKRLAGRTFSFEDGECLDDVGKRADRFIDGFLNHHLESSEQENIHIVAVAHGIFNSELMGTLLRRRPRRQNDPWNPVGMTNTGWHKVLITPTFTPSTSPSPSLTRSASPTATANADTLSSATAPNPSSVPAAPAPTKPVPGSALETPSGSILEKSDGREIRLKVEILRMNQTGHLKGLERQRGGVGNGAFDPKQGSLRSFFGGGGGGGSIGSCT